MSRTPEVEEAMRYRTGPISCVLTMSDGTTRYGHEILAAEIERLEAQNARLRKALEWWRDLRDESEGVAGYNLNGRLAYWGEFEDPTDEALAGTEEAK